MENSIIIYGAGPAGLTAALSLSNYVKDIVLIEPCNNTLYDSINEQDTRTTALSYNTKKLYESLGVWKKVAVNAGPIQNIEIVDSSFISGDSPLNLHFASDDVGDEPMGYIVENRFFKAVLLEAVKLHKNIKIQYGRKIKNINSDSFKANITFEDGSEVSTNLLIIADGKNSNARDLLAIETEDKPYNQVAITFNIEHENSHQQVATERFMATGPFAVLPMNNLKQSSVVWTVSDKAAPIYLNMNDEDFLEEVQERLNGNLGGIKFISKRLKYPLSLKYVKKYFEGKAVLIGDAAHGIHPIAGQGFNQGVKDIIKLKDLIEAANSLGLPINSENLLNKYQSQAYADNSQMVMATDFFNSLFSNDNFALKHSRRIGISAVNNVKKVKSFFIKKAMGA